MSQNKTIRYYNKNINDSIKLVRTCSGNEKSFFHSILTCTMSNYVTFSENKRNKLVEKYITSIKKSFQEELMCFYNYILKKDVKPDFADKIIKKSSYIDLYSMICNLVKINSIPSEIEDIVRSAKEIIYTTKLPQDKKEYFFKKFQYMITTISEYINKDISINDKTVNQVSKNLNRNIYCIDYHNEERIVISSDTNFSKTILVLKINNNYEAIGIVKEDNIIKRDFQASDKDVKKILNILNNSDYSTTSQSDREEKFEHSSSEQESELASFVRHSFE
jgi:hypothetical protein